MDCPGNRLRPRPLSRKSAEPEMPPAEKLPDDGGNHNRNYDRKHPGWPKGHPVDKKETDKENSL